MKRSNSTEESDVSKRGKVEAAPVKNRHLFEHPLNVRYSSPAMSSIWSDHNKFSTWRKVWIALATAEKQLGLPITQGQLDSMNANVENIDFAYAEAKEKELRHDVMSHIHTFGKACPEAAGIIHLGATSCFITDNSELTLIKQSIKTLLKKLLKVVSLLKDFSVQYKDMPTLGFTHYQPAQLTTVGKRATLWLQDFLMDFEGLNELCEKLPFRGVKGTTGTQASFLELFKGDHEQVKKLDGIVCKLMGFNKSIPVSGQTYTRKVDYKILSVLSGIAQSAHKMCTDIRLLANLKEVEEPFGKKQVGSSAMAYKRNPMRCERVCSIARYVMSLPINAAQTHAVQWFERTLDDSANRRVVLPDAFLAVDGVLNIVANIVDGMQVWPQVIHKRVMSELPFMATENILMECVKKGGDRQDLHEYIREHSMEAGRRVKEEGAANDLMERIAKDDRFKVVHASLASLTDPTKFIGRSSHQVVEFVAAEVEPVLQEHAALLEGSVVSELKV